MSDQELLNRITQGDQAALTELCDSHAELIRKRAQWITRQYNCLRPSNVSVNSNGAYTGSVLRDIIKFRY